MVTTDERRGVLELHDIHYAYPSSSSEPASVASSAGALRGVDLRLERGERVAVLGPNGSGKSTLLRCAAMQLAPSRGAVLLDGHPLQTRSDGERARRSIAYVGQDPDNQIVASTVFDEVAFGPCNMGLSPDAVRTRVTEALELCDLEGFDGRDVSCLSGGQRQRLALAGVVAMGPDYLLLDEPCSMLDPSARSRVLAVIDRLAAAGVGVLHVTHELGEVMAYDRLVVVQGGRIAWEGTPGAFLLDRGAVEASACLLSPWLRCARDLVEAGLLPSQAPLADPVACGGMAAANVAHAKAIAARVTSGCATSEISSVELLRADGLFYTYEGTGDDSWAVRDANVGVRSNCVLLVAGQTGSGKSTLAQLLAGLRDPSKGTVRMGDIPVRAGSVGYAFQRAEDQLFANTVLEDVMFGPRNRGRTKEQARLDAEDALGLVGLDPNRWGSASPFALSGGQMRRVALAGVFAMGAPCVMLDEPTVGLDARGCEAFAAVLAELGHRGVGVVMISHDIERVAPMATDALLLTGGTTAWKGPACDLLTRGRVLAEAGLGTTPIAAFVQSLEEASRGCA